jgi:hypothetical protein
MKNEVNEIGLCCKAYFRDGQYLLVILREEVCLAAFSYSDATTVLNDFSSFAKRGHWTHFKNQKNVKELVLAYNESYRDDEYISDDCFAACYGTTTSVYPSELRRLKDFDFWWNCWVANVNVLKFDRLDGHRFTTIDKAA